VPNAGSRDPDVVVKELTAFRVEANPVAAALSKINSAFQILWPLADSVEKQAAQLHIFGNRLAQLCSATSHLKIPQEVFGQTVALGDSVRARHAWTGVALDELLCCGDARTQFMDVGLVLTDEAIEDSITNLAKRLDEHLLSGGDDSRRRLTSERFGLALTIDRDAVVVRNTTDVVVMFVDETENIESDSVGPGAWVDGPAIRIRRLRNGSELSVAQAITENEGLITRIGALNLGSVEDVPELSGVRYSYLPLEDRWIGGITIFVIDGFTYFVESLCRSDDPYVCELVQTTVDSIELLK